MTTPARTTNSGRPDNSGYYATWNRANNGTISAYGEMPFGTYNSGWVRDMRPASSTSPVRVDGTRAPKAWDRRWGQYFNPYRSVVLYQAYPAYRYYLKVKGAPLVGVSSLDQALDRASAGWCRSPAAGSFDLAAESLARTAFRNAVVDGRAEWGVTLGEMRETIRGISTYCRDLLGLVDYLARATRRTKQAVVETILGIPPRTRKTPPWYKGKDRLIIDHWLAYQFAAKPLLNDIQTSGEALSDLLFNQQKRMLMKVKKGGSSEQRVNAKFAGYPYAGAYEGTVQLIRASQCHISCVYEVTNTSTRTLQQLGLTNPVAVAWELTTLSWGVDYVSNMGQWLQSLAGIEGAAFVEGSLTRVMRVRSAGGFNFRPIGTWKIESGGMEGSELSLFAGRMERTVLSATPTPAISPAWRNRIGLTRMANLLAVTTKLLRP